MEIIPVTPVREIDSMTHTPISGISHPNMIYSPLQKIVDKRLSLTLSPTEIAAIQDSLIKSFNILPAVSSPNTIKNRRRYSVTSFSPASSSPSRSPPKKMARTKRYLDLEVQPPGWDPSSEIFDTIENNIFHFWTTSCAGTLKQPFQKNTWKDSMTGLGFAANVISLIEERIIGLESLYGHDVVWALFSMESTAAFAALFLETEINHYNEKQGAGFHDEEDDSSDYREETPCPPGKSAYATNFSNESPQVCYETEQRHEDIQDGQDKNSENGDKGTDESYKENCEGHKTDKSGSREEHTKRGKGPTENKDNDDRGQNDSDGESNESSDESNDVMDYLHRLDEYAKALGKRVYFLGDLDIGARPYFIPHYEPIPEPVINTTVLYHGTSIKKDAAFIVATIESFLATGPTIAPWPGSLIKPSYLSTLPAVYYSSSMIYARLWPLLKLGVSTYRQVTSIPSQPLLVAISRLSPELMNNSGSAKIARIPQADKKLAAKFANRNLSEIRSLRRKPISKSDKSTQDADVIMSPLPSFEQANLSNCYIGSTMDSLTPLESITMVAGCTQKGTRALAEGVTEYAIFGCGIGTLGVGCTKNDWGNALKFEKME